MKVVGNLMFKLRALKTFLAVSILILFTILASFFAISSTSKAVDSTAESDVNLSINSALALSLSNCDSSSNTQIINLDIIPTPEGLFKSTCQNLEVLTNTPGYTLTTKAEGQHPEYNSGTTTNTLLYQNPIDLTALNIELPTIPSTTSPVTAPTALANNQWGFAVEGLNSTTTPSNEVTSSIPNFDTTYTQNNQYNNYAELPTTDTTLYKTTTFPLPKTNFTFFYATKLDTTTLAGIYATTITYTAIGEAVPEPIAYPKVGNGVYFQETTTNIGRSCSGLPMYDSNKSEEDNAGSTVTMIDKRNNQEYRVRRLQDGRCWMMDNLMLATPGTALILTSTDSNIVEGTTFTIPPNAVTTATERATNGTCVDGTASGTAGILTCDGTATQSEANNKFIAYVDPTNTTNCLNNTATNGDTNAYNPDSITGCGYLYNWYTATAGTGNYSVSTGDVTDSICPVGWKLPSAGSGTATATNEFAVLNGAMISTGPSIADNTTIRPNWYTTGPFSSTYAGSWTTGFYNQGYYGYYWSSSAYATIFASNLFIYYSAVNPGNNANLKHYGVSVRCVL